MGKKKKIPPKTRMKERMHAVIAIASNRFIRSRRSVSISSGSVGSGLEAGGGGHWQESRQETSL